MSFQGESALEPASRHLLETFGQGDWSDDLYLAGSAALSLYLAHRPVRDLDFMTSGNRLRAADRRDLLGQLLELRPETRVETARDGFLYVRIGSVAVRFFYYPYPVIDPFEWHSGVAVASLIDLALMKLGAIISRGTRRDFIDMFFTSRQLPLADVLERAEEKFGHVRDFPLQALKGLADRSLTIGEPIPDLAAELDWQNVEDWIEGDVRQLARRRIGLGESEDRP